MMVPRSLDFLTVREAFVYLYRCWLQKHWDMLPEKLALSEKDGLLVCKEGQFFYSTIPVSSELTNELQGRFTNVCIFAPAVPTGIVGVTCWCSAGLPYLHARVIDLVIDNLDWLDQHGERAMAGCEAYETSEYGTFEVWRGRNAVRLLLQPTAAELYGYAVVINGPSDFFFRRSRSCRKEGHLAGSGQYKRSIHRFGHRQSRTNIDLVYTSGEVQLLALVLAGAGFKVFPRRTPDPKPNGFSC